MSDTRKHRSFVDTARSLAQGDWGYPDKTDSEAKKQLMTDPDRLSGAALLAILRRVDLVVEAIAAGVIEEKAKQMDASIDAAIAEFARERSVHGPIPSAVEAWQRKNLYRIAGEWLSWHKTIIVINAAWCQIPPKGTVARRAYDRWMKAKPKDAAPESTG